MGVYLITLSFPPVLNLFQDLDTGSIQYSGQASRDSFLLFPSPYQGGRAWVGVYLTLINLTRPVRTERVEVRMFSQDTVRVSTRGLTTNLFRPTYPVFARERLVPRLVTRSFSEG
jgi:hypothetical protein